MNGWAYHKAFQPAARGRYLNSAIAELEFAAGAPLRPSIVCVPKETTTLEAYGGQIIEQVQLPPGAWVTAVQIAPLAGASAADFTVQVQWDFDNAAPLFSHPIGGRLLLPAGAIKQMHLPRPKAVTGSGSVTVTITNLASGTRSAQVCLRVLVPEV